MAVGPDKPDRMAAPALTALTKCRSLNGGAGRGKGGGGGEAEEKRVASEVGRGRRRSFGAADVDVGCVFAGAGARVVAKDMPPLMMVHAVTFARKVFDGMEKFSSKTLAFSLKKVNLFCPFLFFFLIGVNCFGGDMAPFEMCCSE